MKKILHFERAEFLGRLAAVKQEMSKRGLDILLLSEPPHQNYLTGYDAWSYYTPQMVVVALNQPEPIWIGRGMDRASGRRTTWLAEDNIRGYPDHYVQSSTHTPCDYYAEVVKEIAGERARVGVEFGGYYYSARTHADLQRALPQAELIDADLLVSWIRIVKSPAEVAVMRQAGQIADAMMKRAIDTVEPGIRECDLAAAVYHQMIAGTPEFGGSYTCAPPHLCIGDRIIEPHPIWRDDPIEPGATMYLELFGNRHRYQVQLSRTVVLGEPSAQYRQLADVAVDAMNSALESVRPGRTAEEVTLVFTKALARHGIEKDSRLGYSIGLGYPPAVGERTASLRKGDQTVLQPGMTFHMMPGLWLEDTGVAITQSFAVTETGHEALTSTPRRLYVK